MRRWQEEEKVSELFQTSIPVPLQPQDALYCPPEDLNITAGKEDIKLLNFHITEHLLFTYF